MKHTHFVEFLVKDPSASSGWRCLGTQNVTILPGDKDYTWSLGYAGRRYFEYTKPFVLEKGPREVEVKASPEKPVAGFMMLQRLEGRTFKHPLDLPETKTQKDQEP